MIYKIVLMIWPLILVILYKFYPEKKSISHNNAIKIEDKEIAFLNVYENVKHKIYIYIYCVTCPYLNNSWLYFFILKMQSNYH